MKQLLTRDEFRTSVFERDNHLCVMCHKPAVDVHHIIDRKQFTNGGYYLDNGVSLCSEHHIESENGTIGCQTLRDKAGIKNIVLPEEFDDTLDYNKWGEPIAPGNRYKYPKTFHFEFSPGVMNDDRTTFDLSSFEGEEVIATEKMDGENTSMLRDSIYARSMDSNNHPSRNWVKGLWGSIRYDIPENWRICGENVYAKHSVGYDDLDTYFYVFSIWNEDNVCLSWDDTVEWCNLLGLKHVKVLYRGVFDIEVFKNMGINPEKQEGFVVRLTKSFKFSNFIKSVIKWVRKGHIQTDEHWMSQKIEPNKLKKI